MRNALVAAAVLSLSLAACSSNEVDSLAFQDVPADTLYNEGLSLMNDGNTRAAIVKFEEVDRLHPYSDYGRKSMVMLAYASYKRGRYDEAIASGRRFVALYPGHEDAAYAQYIVGNSYFKQIPDVTLDQGVTERALAAMDELIRKYPESPYAEDARKKVLATRDQLAGREMEVGRFYLERDDHLAAINRFRTVVETYQNTRHVEEGLYRLAETYYALGVADEAQTAAAVLGHNFPDSQWYRHAYALLGKQGLKPQEHEGSWITQTWKGDGKPA